MQHINYKENGLLVSRVNLFAFLLKPFEEYSPKEFSKIEEDIRTIIPYLENIKIENIFSDVFLNSILGIKNVTNDYYFKDYELFGQYDFFKTLFYLAFPIPGNECDFLQSRALKIMRNLVECPIKWYVNQLVQMEVIQKTSEIFISNSDAVINSAIKLLISIAPADISFTQDIFTFIKVKTLIETYNRFKEYDSIKNNIPKLIYYISRCDVNSDIVDFIDFIYILIDLIKSQFAQNCFDKLFIGTIITIFLISHNLMKNSEVVSLFYKFPLFIELLNYSLKLNDNYTIYLPALKTIDYMHYYGNGLIEGLNYELFLSYLDSDLEESTELVIESLINIFTCQSSIVLFINKYDIINKLVYIRSAESSFAVKMNAIEAISNAILCSPTYLLSSFIKSGCIGELIQSFYIENNKTLCKIIESLDILLNQKVLDEQENNITEIDFCNNFDENCIAEIQGNEDEKVRLAFEKLTLNHPNLFQK